MLVVRHREPKSGAVRQLALDLGELAAGPGRDVSVGDVLLGESATVHGRVRASDRAAMPGGHKGTAVFVPEGPFATFTADDGSFTLSELPPGTLRLAFFRSRRFRSIPRRSRCRRSSTLGRRSLVAPGAAVTVLAAASSADPTETFTYAWTQDPATTPHVQLVGADRAAVAFSAPAFWAALRFSVTVTGSNGGVTSASVAVEVHDTTPPKLVASDPFDGGTGSFLSASATFDKPLAPESVTAANVFIADADGGVVSSDVVYDPPTRKVTVEPRRPLSGAGAFTFTLGGVYDSSPERNTHPTEALAYRVRPNQWGTWTFASATLSLPPTPGVVVLGAGVEVFARQPGPGGAIRAESFTPQAAGTLAWTSHASDVGACAVASRRGVSAGGVAYYNAACGTVLAEGAAGWTSVNVQNPAANNAPIDLIFSDGSALLGLGSAAYGAYDPGMNAWSGEHVASLSYSGSAGSGSGGGRIFAAVTEWCCNEATDLLVYERMSAGTWTLLPGTLNPPSLAGGALTDSYGAAPRSRLALVHGQPFIAWETNDPSQLVHAAAWKPGASGAAGSWTVFADVGQGSAANFDVVARGDIAYVAVVHGGKLHLRRLDLSAASPAWEDVPGPSGPTLDDDLGGTANCTSDLPELAAAPDALYVTWQELCPAQYTVVLRKLN